MLSVAWVQAAKDCELRRKNRRRDHDAVQGGVIARKTIASVLRQVAKMAQALEESMPLVLRTQSTFSLPSNRSAGQRCGVTIQHFIFVQRNVGYPKDSVELNMHGHGWE